MSGATPGSIVTLVFTDVEGSSRLWQALPDATRDALQVHDDVLRRVAGQHGGYEIRTEGDAFKFAFGSPAAAVRFCTDAQVALLSAAWPAGLLADERCREAEEGGCVAWRGLRVRMGAHFGAAEPRAHPVTGRLDWYGPTVNTTARIAEAPAGGQVVASALVWDAARREDPRLDVVVEDHGEHRLRGVELPEHLLQLAPTSLAGRTFPPLRTESALRLRIPPAHDRFVGREGGVEAIHGLLEHGRIVTLHGPGGTGKTRLALEVARRRGHAWPGGAWFVGLAEARGAADAAAGVVAALHGTGPAGAALARIGKALVVLDNVEQLGPDGVAEIGRWLDAAPEVRFLATSRHPLGLPAERRYTVDGLDAEAAIALFVDRAGGGDPRAVARLVDRLDRLPLAIELAAARTELMSVAEIERRLDQRFRLLAAPSATGRHATLRAAIAWSWDLLDDAERACAAQCAVFVGGFGVEAAEAVVDLGEGPWVVDVLQSLLRKSILRQLPDRRLGMFESIRAYASERLGPAPEVHERHARWFLEAGQRWKAALYGPDDLAAYQALRAESDNFVAAHDHLRTRDPLAAARLIDVFDPEMLPIVNAGPVDLPGDLDARLAEAIGAAGPDLGLKARLLRQRAERRRLTLDHAGAFAEFREALEVAVASRDADIEAVICRDLSFGNSYGLVEVPEAEDLARRAVRLFEAMGAPVKVAMGLFAVTLIVRLRDVDAFEALRKQVADRITAHGGPARKAQRDVSACISDVLLRRFDVAWAEYAPTRETFGRLGLPIDPFITAFGAFAAAGVGRIDDAERNLADLRAAPASPQMQGLVEAAQAYLGVARCIRARAAGEPVDPHVESVRAAFAAIASPPDGGPSIEERRPIVHGILDACRAWAASVEPKLA